MVPASTARPPRGPSVVYHIQAMGPRSALAWGRLGNFVCVTEDAGRTWFATDFPSGILRLTSAGASLRVRAFGPRTSSAGSEFEMYLYVSRDHGMTWRLGDRLAHLSF